MGLVLHPELEEAGQDPGHLPGRLQRLRVRRQRRLHLLRLPTAPHHAPPSEPGPRKPNFARLKGATPVGLGGPDDAEMAGLVAHVGITRVPQGAHSLGHLAKASATRGPTTGRFRAGPGTRPLPCPAGPAAPRVRDCPSRPGRERLEGSPMVIRSLPEDLKPAEFGIRKAAQLEVGPASQSSSRRSAHRRQPSQGLQMPLSSADVEAGISRILEPD